MQDKEKCSHATPLSETALIPTIQNREGNQRKKNKDGDRRKREGEGKGKGEWGRVGRGKGEKKERGREGLHLKMHHIKIYN